MSADTDPRLRGIDDAQLSGSDADRVIAITDCGLDPILFEINLPAFVTAIDEINATEYKNA